MKYKGTDKKMHYVDSGKVYKAILFRGSVNKPVFAQWHAGLQSWLIGLTPDLTTPCLYGKDAITPTEEYGLIAKTIG